MNKKKIYCDNFYIKKAEEKDSKNIFELSNMHDIRESSINSNFITWEKHLIWFKNKLNDKNYSFWVIYSNDNIFLGQVRFEINDIEAIVSISLIKDLRGKGIAKKIFKKIFPIFFLENKDVKLILAYIKPDNIFSIKFFEKYGFIFDSQKKKNNTILNLYKYKNI